MGPKDAVQQYAVPINTETGKPLTDRQLHHLQALTEAIEPLYEAMHAADGSAPPGEHQEHIWTGRRMAIAATHIETALMFARKAALQ